VVVLGRHLPGEPRRAALDVIAGALDLIDEVVHVGREAAGQEHADVELSGRRVLLGLVEAGPEVLQGLGALCDHFPIHTFLRSAYRSRSGRYGSRWDGLRWRT